MIYNDAIILGIESSCDETAAAVVSESRGILSNVVYSQLAEHRPFSGVVPEIAARAHLERMPSVVARAVAEAEIDQTAISAVAAACGPGLIGSVTVGATFAKAMAIAWSAPFIAVNHIEAHALCARLTDTVDFPYLLLLISGGHCQICLVHSVTKFEILGKTLDDSPGEALDKVAKMLSLEYPGGPLIEKLSANGDPKRFRLPRPLYDSKNSDFSFSGLKTAVRRLLEKQEVLFNEQDKADLCASFQRTLSEILCHKVNAAIEICKSRNIDLKTFVASGGVAANKVIREDLERLCGCRELTFSSPPIHLCTDNGAMIAWNAIERFRLGLIDRLDFVPRPRWQMGT
ncbi:MAG: tRNA (adenosine(37)-N6)-threonylcarbamoyltransferase complex transferase subunit TsaD [Holosporaceae bacterium]|jgi:N6-L-threonylcarbamoyladenine synthase|nr:tRNA (adenosine(37)-N6)-threonylcarbamoyltransferase complex transferase subunit TsaD [Holosporaceae bacterium]